MLDEAELNKKEIAIDQLVNKSSNEIVDGLLSAHDGVAADALSTLNQKIDDGYNSKEMLLAKKKLEDIIEACNKKSKTHDFMETIMNQNKLFEEEKPKKFYIPKIDRGENKKLNMLIDAGIPPSVLLNNKQLIFKTTIGSLGSNYIKNDPTDTISSLEKQLANPFIRASEKERLKKELDDIKNDSSKYYMFRVKDVKPEGVVIENYYKTEPKRVTIPFGRLLSIMNDPINEENTAKAFEFFPEAESPAYHKTVMYGNQQKIRHAYFLWYKENEKQYDLDKYNRYEKVFIFKCNVFMGYSINQAIRFLKAMDHLEDYLSDDEMKKEIQNVKIRLNTKESSLSEEIVYRTKNDNSSENLGHMKKFIRDNSLNTKLFKLPFEAKIDTEHMNAGEWYEIVGTPFDTNEKSVKIKQVSEGEGYGEETEISITELKLALNFTKDIKYLLTSNHSLKNIALIRKYLDNHGINSQYIDIPFVYKPEVKTNKWAQKRNDNFYKPVEHRYIIAGVPISSEIDTLKLKEILPNGLSADFVEMPIDTVKKSIENNSVSYNTMVNPANGEVVDVALDPKLRNASYVHGIQGKFYPLTEENVESLLLLAQKVLGTDMKPIYVDNLLDSYKKGKNDLEVKEAMKDMWDLLELKNFLQVKTVEGKLKFYYTLGDALLHSDRTNSMIKYARRKEGQ